MTKKICASLVFIAVWGLNQGIDAQTNSGATILVPGGAMRTPDGQIILPDQVEDEQQSKALQVKSMKCFSDRISGQELKYSLNDGFTFGGEQTDGTYQAELKDATFPEDQLVQYFEFDFGAEGAGKTIDVHVISARTTVGYGLSVLRLRGDTDEKGILVARWNLNGSWPVGLYQVFFACEGKDAGGMGYRVRAVTDRESRITATGVKIFVSNDNGDYEEKLTLKPSDRNLVIECTTSGANTKGVTVDMYLEKEKNNKFVMIDNSQTLMQDWPLEDTRLVYTIETPVAFPVGAYRMVFAINGRKIAEHPFKIQ